MNQFSTVRGSKGLIGGKNSPTGEKGWREKEKVKKNYQKKVLKELQERLGKRRTNRRDEHEEKTRNCTALWAKASKGGA